MFSPPPAVPAPPASTPNDGAGPAWPVDSSACAELIRGLADGRSPLGPPESWPPALKTAVDLMLPVQAQMVLFWGPDLVALYNDAYAPSIGNKHPRALGRPAREAWAELWPDLGPLLDGVFTTGQTFAARDREFRIERHGYLETVYFDVSYSALREASGAIGGVMCIVSETTERVRNAIDLRTRDAQLSAEQAFTRLVLDSTEEGFYAVDRDGRTTLCNASCQRLLGYDSDAEMIGRRLHAEGSILRAAREGVPARVSGEEFVRRDGSRFPADYRVQPIWRDGRLEGAVCTFIDVSARVEQGLALKRSEAVAREAAERIDLARAAGIVLGTWVWGVADNRVIGDEPFARAFSLDPAQVAAGVPLADVLAAIHPDDVPGVRATLRQALDAGSAYRAQYRLRQADGGWNWVEAHGRVERGSDGQPLRFPGVLIAINERKHAEDELEATNHQFRLAQRAGGIGVFALDIASNRLTVSAEFCRVFGLAPVTSLAPGVVEALHHPDDADRMSTRESRSRGDAPLDVEYRIRRADTGEVRWISRRAEFSRDASGRPLQMLGAVQDVTERKLAEATLRASEAQFRALAQALPNQVWTAAADGALDWFNDKVFDYSGMAQPELAGQGWARMVHPDDLPGVSAQWQASLGSGKRYEAEFRLRRHDASFRWHLVRALPIPSDAGPPRWVGTNTDIDDQKSTQAALARLNSRLEERVEERTRDRDRIWRLSTDVMMVARFDGRISAVNPAWAGLLGWHDADLLGASYLDLVHPQDRAATEAEGRRLASGQPTLRFENRFRHRDGSWRTIAWTAVPDADFIHAVGRDVTAERLAALALQETQDRLRQSQKMEAIGQLTGGIAHDFNNLLTGIIGSLEIVRRRVAAGRVAEVGRYMDAATASAQRAAALTHRLLAFARRQSLDARPIDVNALITSMQDLLQRTLGEQVAIEVRLGAGLWPAFSDENQLENALLNLAINARDAMPDGGRLVITSSNLRLAEADSRAEPGLPAGDYVEIDVADSGVGMAPEVAAKAFDPFFTTKPVGQGTGLGLSMIYGFARQSGGHVRLDSEPGRGTTVRLVLPRAAGAAESDLDVQTPEAPRGAGETVLLVEDDAAVRQLVVAVLADLGYRAIEAADGQQAIPILESVQALDLLITDVGLPGLNGRQVAEIARAHRPGLPVLFITGYAANAAVRSEFLGDGMQMISKPFSMDELALRVREIIGSRPG